MSYIEIYSHLVNVIENMHFFFTFDSFEYEDYDMYYRV